MGRVRALVGTRKRAFVLTSDGKRERWDINCYVNVLRDAMAVDSLDPCGVYFGTTGGQVYASADAGDSWAPIVRDLPSVVSVEVQTLS